MNPVPPPDAAPPAAVIVLAAGAGTRMRSTTPKVLHEVAGRSLLGHVVDAARTLEPEHLVVVVGHGGDQVAAHLATIAPAAQPVVQDEQRGTGHAVRIALEALPPLDGVIVVVAGDCPLLTAGTFELARRAARRAWRGRHGADRRAGRPHGLRPGPQARRRGRLLDRRGPRRQCLGAVRARDQQWRVRLRCRRARRGTAEGRHREQPGRGVPHRRDRPAPSRRPYGRRAHGHRPGGGARGQLPGPAGGRRGPPP